GGGGAGPGDRGGRDGHGGRRGGGEGARLRRRAARQRGDPAATARPDGRGHAGRRRRGPEGLPGRPHPAPALRRGVLPGPRGLTSGSRGPGPGRGEVSVGLLQRYVPRVTRKLGRVDTTLTDPLIGRLLDGRYRVESRIARGGMASVYLALDVRLERTVAVKVMHPSLAEDPQFVQRFIGEAKSVARLSHPNIVQVFDQGTDGTHVYLSMEYIPRRSLREMLRARRRLPVREALEIVIPVLAALGAAHQAGLIHRDIKPENVLIADDGRVKVVDFGLARAIHGGHLTRTGTMIGTIGYMSPEQVTTGTADARSDVYAVGIMLFELLTGRQPYAGETAMSIAYRHVHENVPAPSSVVPGIPASVDALVRSATDRDPDRRPRDATAMLVAAVAVPRGLTQGGAAHPTPPPGSGTATAVHPAEDLDPVPEREERLAETMIQPQVELLTSPGTAEPRARRGPRPAIWFIGALTLLMLAGIAFSAWWFSQGRYVKVPDLRGQNIVVARQIAQRAGFEVKIGEPRFDDKIEKDRVLDTEPGAGAEVVR